MVKKAALAEVLSKIMWGGDYNLENVEIYYVHRGAPDDYEIMYGTEIKEVEGGFIIKVDGTYIPMHRVFLVKYGNEILYENRGKMPPSFIYGQL